MPLKPGKSKEAFKSNVSELVEANKSKNPDKKRPMKQILAIAYSQQRKSNKKKK